MNHETKTYPKSLDEAIQILLEDNAVYLANLRKKSKSGFISENHLYAGMNMRNNWSLWYNKPGNALTDWFSSHDINHGDDRSGAIMEAFFAKVNAKEFNLEAYKARLKKHWLEYGPRKWNGICPTPGTGE